MKKQEHICALHRLDKEPGVFCLNLKEVRYGGARLEFLVSDREEINLDAKYKVTIEEIQD